MAEVYSVNQQAISGLRSTATLAERNFIEEVKRQTCKCGLKVPAQVELHGIKVTLSLVFAKGYFTIMINVKVVSPQV